MWVRLLKCTLVNDIYNKKRNKKIWKQAVKQKNDGIVRNVNKVAMKMDFERRKDNPSPQIILHADACKDIAPANLCLCQILHVDSNK